MVVLKLMNNINLMKKYIYLYNKSSAEIIYN